MRRALRTRPGTSVARTVARGGRAPGVAGALLLAGAACAACADKGGTECVCADPTVTVEIPADRAASVVGVQLSGAACAGAHVVCARPAAVSASDATSATSSGCAAYAFRGTSIGACTVALSFAGGDDFQATFEMVRYPCCTAVYASPPQDSLVTVPERGLDDAGAG